MAYSFNDLTQPMTRQQVQTAIYSALATTGINTTSWKTGAVVRTMIVGISAVISALTRLTALIARTGFLELSSGDWLTIVAHYVYSTDRDLATFATGYVTLKNNGGGVYEVDVGDLIVTNPTTQKSYRNTEAFTLEAGQQDLPPIGVSAIEVGTPSNSAAEAITVVTTALPNVECKNAAAVEGRDEETDPELRQRCRETLGALSPMGPWDAYSSAIKNARRSTGASLGVTRVRTVPDGYGNITIYIATATGGVVPSDVAIAQTAVQQWAEPQCVTATVVSATPVAIAVTHETWCYNTSAMTLAQIEAAIYAALRAFVNSQPVGGNKITDADTGKIYADALKATIGGALPTLIVHTDMTVPNEEYVTLAIHEVPVIGVVSSTLHQIPTPQGHAL